jgi:hypothetical protein
LIGDIGIKSEITIDPNMEKLDKNEDLYCQIDPVNSKLLNPGFGLDLRMNGIGFIYRRK